MKSFHCDSLFVFLRSAFYLNLRSVVDRLDSSRLTNQDHNCDKCSLRRPHEGWWCLCASDWGRVVSLWGGADASEVLASGMTGVMMLWRTNSWHLCASWLLQVRIEIRPQHSGLSRRWRTILTWCEHGLCLCPLYHNSDDVQLSIIAARMTHIYRWYRCFYWLL